MFLRAFASGQNQILYGSFKHCQLKQQQKQLGPLAPMEEETSVKHCLDEHNQPTPPEYTLLWLKNLEALKATKFGYSCAFLAA